MTEKESLAFASDFDNTFYFRNGYKESDCIAIKDFQSKGNLFGFCTGRCYHGVIGPINGAITPDFYILATGSLILDRDGFPIYENPIPKYVIKAIYDEVSSLYEIAFNSGYDFLSFKSNFEIFNKITSWDEVPEKNFGISFLTENKERAKTYVESLPKKYPVSVFQNGPFVDITGLGSSKGKGLMLLKDIFHLDRIACMGDSYNDIPMLETADIPFTFPNSPDSVKEKAAHILPSLQDAIESLL